MARSKKSYGVKECVICGKEFIPQNDEQMACKTVCANEVRIRAFETKRIAGRAKKMASHYIAWVYHKKVEMRENGVDMVVWRLEYIDEMKQMTERDWDKMKQVLEKGMGDTQNDASE